MSYSAVCSDAGLQAVSGVITPSGPFNGTALVIGILDDASFGNWGSYKPLARIFPANPVAGNSLIITPSTTDGLIKVYSFSSADVLTKLWQVPDANGEPVVPIGTTFAVINDVINACGAAGMIYYDTSGPKVTA